MIISAVTVIDILSLMFEYIDQMAEDIQDPHRQQRLYWNQMLQLKGAAIYMRLYRESLGRWVTRLATIKAIASCAGIAAWAVWKELAFVWAIIIALSQVLDALKDVFPFSKLHKAANEHCVALNALFIDAEFEWENIFLGRYSNDEIINRLHKLKRLQLEAEKSSFPDGLDLKSKLKSNAEHEALEYFVSTNAVE